MKKQRKVDPEIAQLRENRRRRKLEKEIRMLMGHNKDPRPVQELAVLSADPTLELEKRRREPVVLSEEEEDELAVLIKDYTRYRYTQALADQSWVNEAVKRQDRALGLLKELNPRLYELAIQPEEGHTLPFRFNGPTLTPPIDGYQNECPDGEYIDTTKKYGGV